MFKIKFYKSNLRAFYQWHSDISGTILYKMTILRCSVAILCLTKQSLLAGPYIVTALAMRHCSLVIVGQAVVEAHLLQHLDRKLRGTNVLVFVFFSFPSLNYFTSLFISSLNSLPHKFRVC